MIVTPASEVLWELHKKQGAITYETLKISCIRSCPRELLTFVYLSWHHLYPESVHLTPGGWLTAEYLIALRITKDSFSGSVTSEMYHRASQNERVYKSRGYLVKMASPFQARAMDQEPWRHLGAR